MKKRAACAGSRRAIDLRRMVMMTRSTPETAPDDMLLLFGCFVCKCVGTDFKRAYLYVMMCKSWIKGEEVIDKDVLMISTSSAFELRRVAGPCSVTYL